MLKHVFLAHFEPKVMRFGPWISPKCLASAPLRNPKWVKNGSKARFSYSVPGPFGMLKQTFLAHFGPNLTRFSSFRHMYAPNCTLRPYLRAV